ncbi:MAG: hypothetical protein QW594_03490 [Candidatus Woesearchaeota archaeon]
MKNIFGQEIGSNSYSLVKSLFGTKVTYYTLTIEHKNKEEPINNYPSKSNSLAKENKLELLLQEQ